MRKFGFIKKQDEDDETYNLRILSLTFRNAVGALFDKQCDKCTYLDRFECLLNPKCTVHCRSERTSDDGVDFMWQVEVWLEREDKRFANQHTSWIADNSI